MELQQNIINDIRNLIDNARNSIVKSVNWAMVITYWEIGKRIADEEQNGEERAKYGSYLIKNLALQLTIEFGKGFDERELRKMRQFYVTFPIRDTVRPELSWSHYRLLMKVLQRLGVLDNYINKLIQFSVLNGSEQLFASQYQLYLPTEEQLKQWMNKQRLFLDLNNDNHE